MANFEDLIDDFTAATLDTTLWTTRTNASIQAGKAVLTCVGSGTAELRSAAVYNFVAADASVTFARIYPPTGLVTFTYAVHRDASNYIGWRLTSTGLLRAVIVNAGADGITGGTAGVDYFETTYDPAVHKYLLITHTATDRWRVGYSTQAYGGYTYFTFTSRVPSWTTTTTMYARFVVTAAEQTEPTLAIGSFGTEDTADVAPATSGYGSGNYSAGLYGNPTTPPVTSGYGAGLYGDSLYAGSTIEPATSGYGAGAYGSGQYAGTPAPPAAAGYGSGDYGAGIYPGTDTGNIEIGYGSGPYGAGIYPGTVRPGETIIPGTPAYPEPILPALHILGIGPWNPVKTWHGAVNYGIGKGIAPARPALQLPGVQSKSFTLRLNGGSEATATCQFPRNDALVIEEMSTDLWWRRRDPYTGDVDVIGRFNTSHNDLSRADDGTVSSSLQFQDYRTILGNRMVLKYKDPNATPNPTSMWDKGTPITEIMRFAVPKDLGIDLSALDDDTLLGDLIEAFHLPPYATIAQTFDALLVHSPKPWEWWIDIPAAVTAPPKLTFTVGQRGVDKGITLFDYGTGPTPIASWQMRATSDNYANTLYFQGGSTTSTTPAGGVIVNNPTQIAEYGERDAQDSDGSINGALINYINAANKRLTVLMDRRPTFTVVLKPGFWRGLRHIGIGDKIRLRLKLGRELITYEYRVTELQVDIDEAGMETVTLTFGTPLASANPRSQYSPVFKLVRALRNYVPPDGAPAFDATT